ncbi:MAG: sulfite exporter TauE/SafE family protein [Methyloceanibacter sp.]
MFQVYLPVAEISVNVLVMLGLGAAVGILSGMFGVGGGFLLTPLLMFSGIPPAIAVATGANQIVASSVSGALVQWRRDNIDFRMGLVLIAGGVVGAFAGVFLVKLLSRLGHAGIFISLVYVTFLGVIGSLMFVESLRAILRTRSGKPSQRRKPGEHTWIHGLPLKMRFHRSRLYISAIPPLVIGAIVGLLASVLGVGGGFIVVPAMIYLLRMPTNVVIGTSLFQIIFITAVITILYATLNQTLDVVLAFILVIGGVIGGQIGANTGQKMKGEHLRILLAIIVLAVAIRLLFGVVVTPDDLYSAAPLGMGV